MFLDTIFNCIGRWITARLKQPLRGYEPFAPCDPAALRGILRPADVILVDGNQRISSAIKYLTQSTWSHAALYIGEVLAVGSQAGEQSLLIEANLEDGVVAVAVKVPCLQYPHLPSGGVNEYGSAQGGRVHDGASWLRIRYATHR
jgi:hypothetical protein